MIRQPKIFFRLRSRFDQLRTRLARSQFPHAVSKVSQFLRSHDVEGGDLGGGGEPYTAVARKSVLVRSANRSGSLALNKMTIGESL